MKSHTEYLTFNLPRRVGFERITEQVQRIVTESGVREGLALVNAKRIQLMHAAVPPHCQGPPTVLFLPLSLAARRSG